MLYKDKGRGTNSMPVRQQQRRDTEDTLTRRKEAVRTKKATQRLFWASSSLEPVPSRELLSYCVVYCVLPIVLI